jgi:hypothetical protein
VTAAQLFLDSTVIACAAAAAAGCQVSAEVIEKLRTSVFGFDTMWVTSVENYEQV